MEYRRDPKRVNFRMPGIVGFVDFSHSFSKDLLPTMLEQVKYGDHYIVDRYHEDSFVAGRADLSTFNPDPQPSAEMGVIVFCQGNIVNKSDLQPEPQKTSNSEMIAHQFCLMGPEFVNKVKGHFTTTIWDSKNQRLFLINDRFGKHQMYLWSPQPETLFFACEVKSIIPIAKDKLRLNIQAVADFMQFQFLPGDQTYFENVSLLPPATILRFDRQGCNCNRYWRPRIGPLHHSMSKKKYCAELHELVSTAVSRVTKDHKAALLLSGGLDTRNIAAHVPSSKEIVHSFTYGVSDSQDSKIAALVAKERGFQFHFVPVTAEVIPDFAAMSMWLLEGNATVMTAQNMVILEEAERNAIDVILDGISGNPIFALPIPYSLFTFALLSLPIVDRLTLRLVGKSFSSEEAYIRIRNNYFRAPSDEEILEVLSDDFAEKVAPLMGTSLRKAIAEAGLESDSIFDVNTSVLLTEYIRRVLINTQNSCRWRVELVDTLLDYDLVDFALRLPNTLKLWRKLVVEEIAAYHPTLGKIPLHGYSRPSVTNVLVLVRMVSRRIPIIRRFARGEPKTINGFAGILREKKDYFEEILLDERASSRGIFNAEKIRLLFDEHVNGVMNHTRLLYRALSLELWFRSLEDKYNLTILRWPQESSA